MDKPTKITFAELRELGVRGVLIYCADHGEVPPLFTTFRGLI